MLKAWNTGHNGGLGTVHANTGGDALHRLEDLIAEVTTTVPKRLIAQTVDLVIHLKRSPSGRRIDKILTVQGLRDDSYITAVNRL